jgi:hypothetical protein
LFFILLYCIGDIGSFDLTLSFEVCRMNYIHDLYSSITVLSYDPLCMDCSIWGSSLCSQEDHDIVFIWIISIFEGDDVLFYDGIWLGIDRDYDDMLEMFGSSRDDHILAPVFFL